MLTKMFISYNRNLLMKTLRMKKNMFSSSSNEQTKKKNNPRTTEKKPKIGEKDL